MFPFFVPRRECRHSWAIAILVGLGCVLLLGLIVVIKITTGP